MGYHVWTGLVFMDLQGVMVMLCSLVIFFNSTVWWGVPVDQMVQVKEQVVLGSIGALK